MKNKKPRYTAMFVVGLAFIPLAITSSPAFWGVAIVFMAIGARGLAEEKKEKRDGQDDGKPG